jgi:hypothetical protein
MAWLRKGVSEFTPKSFMRLTPGPDVIKLLKRNLQKYWLKIS